MRGSCLTLQTIDERIQREPQPPTDMLIVSNINIEMVHC